MATVVAKYFYIHSVASGNIKVFRQFWSSGGINVALKITMNSFLNYVGGKSLLTKKIIPLIPKHHCYCEPFCGAAWLLFRKLESKVEIINDINSDLTTLYRVVKYHLDEFIRYLRWLLVARDEFERFKTEDPATLTDIQRAVRFYYLLKTGYGGRIKSPTLSASCTRPSNLNLLRIEEDLSAVHLRLARVMIENRPYSNIIQRFDRPDTFFYLDPPYAGCEDYYGDGYFGSSDFCLNRRLTCRHKRQIPTLHQRHANHSQAIQSIQN